MYDKLVKASDVKEYFKRVIFGADQKIGAWVDSIPAVGAVEVVHGEWIKMDMNRGMENYRCSVCRSECYVPEVAGEPTFPLCPHCGARMDGRREDGDNGTR